MADRLEIDRRSFLSGIAGTAALLPLAPAEALAVPPPLTVAPAAQAFEARTYRPWSDLYLAH